MGKYTYLEYSHLIICLYSLMILSGCGDGLEVELQEKGSFSSQEVQSLLEGTWAHHCGYNLALDARTSRQVEFIAGQEMVVREFVFSDSSCQMLESETTYRRMFSARGNGDLIELDTQLQEVRLRPESQSTVDEYNQDKVCGLDTWSLGQDRLITDSSCAEGASSYYTIVKVIGDELFFGDYRSGEGLSTQTRPSQLDLSTAFKNIDAIE